MVMLPSMLGLRTRGIVMMADNWVMPEQFAEWGCDTDLWIGMPMGAHRDLTRSAKDDKEELARHRITTMRDIFAEIAYAGRVGAAWEKAAWDKGVAENEAAIAAAAAAAKQAAKEAKAVARGKPRWLPRLQRLRRRRQRLYKLL